MVDRFIWCNRNIGFFLGLSRGVVAEVNGSGGSDRSLLCSESLVLAKVIARKLAPPMVLGDRQDRRWPRTEFYQQLCKVRPGKVQLWA